MHIAAREPESLEALLGERGLSATLDRYDAGRFSDLLAVLAGPDAVDTFETPEGKTELDAFLALRDRLVPGPGRYMRLPLRPPLRDRSWSQLLREVAQDGASEPRELSLRQLVNTSYAPHNYGPFLLLLPFANATFIHGDDDDEAIVAAANTPTEAGHHWTYRYSSRSVDLSDAAWPSLAAGMIAVLGPGRGTVLGIDEGGTSDPCALPAHLDPGALSKRAAWIASCLFGISMGNLRRDLAHAAPFVEFEDEKPHLAKHPHLAIHWLFYHFLLGHQAPLMEVLELTKDVEERWVREASAFVQGDASVLPLGALDAALLKKIRGNVPKKQRPGARPKRKAEPVVQVPIAPPPVEEVPEVVAEIYPAFIQWLTSQSCSQREKAARVRDEWLDALKKLPDDQRALVSRLLVAQLNFPEVRADAAAMAEALR